MPLSDIDKFIEITDDDIAEVSKASMKSIADIFNQLMKTVKAQLVYPASSKLPQQFKENLFTSLTLLLEEYSELPFRVESDSVSFNGKKIYTAPNKADNFAHPFFRDGILEIKFKVGLTPEELGQFVEIASQMTRSALLEDDAATLLWEAGFEHISYELMDDFLDIETFEYGTESLRSGVSPSSGDLKNLFSLHGGLELTEEDFDLTSEKNRSHGIPAGYKNVEDNVAGFIREITNYNEAEKAAIESVLRADSEFAYIEYTIDIMFEMLNLETDSAAYNETLDLLTKVGTDFVKSGDFKSVVLVIERAREIGQALQKHEDPKNEKMLGLIDRFAASEKIRVLVDYLNKSKDIDYEQVTTYLKLLSWRAVDSLVWALGELEHFPARRSVCQALEVLAAGHPDIVGKGIESPRWYVVRNIVSILGKMGDPRAFNYFKRTIQHPDIRVRKETVAAAARIVSNEAAEFLVTALGDKDEKIQMMALREIVEKKMFVATGQIEAMITAKDFKSRPSEQVREFLAAYASLAGATSFGTLQKIITQWSLIPSEKSDRLKIHAARALGFTKSPDATALLEKMSRSRNKKLADVARRTLNRVRKGEEIV